KNRCTPQKHPPAKYNVFIPVPPFLKLILTTLIFAKHRLTHFFLFGPQRFFWLQDQHQGNDFSSYCFSLCPAALFWLPGQPRGNDFSSYCFSLCSETSFLAAGVAPGQ
ncbi:MAG: hypothetical protein K6F00_05615, partial [Lachnospiraceae bacterium]|nr:hypothetical protein [Lachnospiraceae bacterium]